MKSSKSKTFKKDKRADSEREKDQPSSKRRRKSRMSSRGKASGSRAKDSGGIKKKKKKVTRAKKPTRLEFILKQQSVPVVTRNMTKCVLFDPFCNVGRPEEGPSRSDAFDSWEKTEPGPSGLAATKVTSGGASAVLGDTKVTNGRASSVLGTSKVTNGRTSAVLGDTKVTNGRASAVLGDTKVTNGRASAVLGATKVTNGRALAKSLEPPVVLSRFTSRSRRLHQKQKVLDYMNRDSVTRRAMYGTLGPIGRKMDISTQTSDDILLPGLLSASGHQNVAAYLGSKAIMSDACVQVDLESGDKRSTSDERKNVSCEKFDMDPDLNPIDNCPLQQDPVWVNRDSQMVTERDAVDAMSSEGDEQMLNQDSQIPTNHCMIIEGDAVDGISSAGDGQMLNRDSQISTNHCMVTERDAVDAISSGGDEKMFENSARGPPEMSAELNLSGGQDNTSERIRSFDFHFEPRSSASTYRLKNSTPPEVSPELSSNGGQTTPEILRSFGFRYEPRSSVSINRVEKSSVWPPQLSSELGPFGHQNSPEIFESSISHCEPRNSAPIKFPLSFCHSVTPEGLPTSPGSVRIADEENAPLGFEPKNRLSTGVSPFCKFGHVSFLPLDTGHVTPPRVQIVHPRALKSDSVDKSNRSHGLREYRGVSPKKIKVLGLSNKRKSEKEKPSAGCLCCRDNGKYVCMCCLELRKELRRKSRRVTPLDVPPARVEPEPMDCIGGERGDEQQKNLNASIKVACSICEKLKAMIQYYRRCSSDE